MIHIIGDIIQSIGVIFAAIIVYFCPDYHIVDPLITILFSVIVIITTLPILKQCLNVFMEARPLEININILKKDILETKGVISLISLHVYSLSLDKLIMNCKIISYDNHILEDVKDRISKYQFYHTNIEVVKNELSYEGCSNINDLI